MREFFGDNERKNFYTKDKKNEIEELEKKI